MNRTGDGFCFAWGALWIAGLLVGLGGCNGGPDADSSCTGAACKDRPSNEPREGGPKAGGSDDAGASVPDGGSDAAPPPGMEPDPEPTCGDGVVEGAEECDDGSNNGALGSRCLEDCTRNVCGDGHIGPAEACDDGNTDDLDECPSTCGFIECGSGILTPYVECDDANIDDHDSCLSSCLWNTCGDGLVLRGVTDPTGPGQAEECDDGNYVDTDGCRNDCTLPYCGDGIVDDGEACDDGNDRDGDTCRSDCTEPRCGDGRLDPGESCDDGNNEDGDACPSECVPVECGSDFGPHGGLVCDDRNDVDTDSCFECHWNSCGDGAVYLVQSDPGNPNPLEECDDGNENDNDTCTNDCKLPICGDAIVGPGEACDDGNDDPADGCSPTCSPVECNTGLGPRPELGIPCDDGDADNSDSCLHTCVWNTCGDGFRLVAHDDLSNPNLVEQCDDGNSSNTDDCLNTCVLNTCGDGFRNPSTEDCDYGALNGPGSNCTVFCKNDECGSSTVSVGEDCDENELDSSNSCLPNCLWNQCGDGAVYATVSDSGNPNPIEECDDADQDDTNSCTSECKYNVCGDGKVFSDRSEPYDDPDGTGPMTGSRLGMNIDGSVVPAWSFSPLDVPFEECDDGNQVAGDGCENDCTLTP